MQRGKNWKKKDKTREIPRNSRQNFRNSREFPPGILGVRDSREFPGIPEGEFPVALPATASAEASSPAQPHSVCGVE